jgi:hypothetical protein
MAVLAMAQHALGQTVRARDSLDRLRQTVKQPDRAGDEEANALFLEAEGSIRREAARPSP